MQRANISKQEIEGFLLTHRVDESSFGQDVLTFYGTGHLAGRSVTFELIIDRPQDVFFIERDSNGHGINFSTGAPEIGRPQRKQTELKTFEKLPVDALYFANSKELKDFRQRLESNGVRTYEADIRSAERYLMERFIFGNIVVSLPSDFDDSKLLENNRHIKLRNPEVRPLQLGFMPKFKVMSLDIETGQKGELYSIAFHQYEYDLKSDRELQSQKKVLMWDEENTHDSTDEVVYLPTQKSILEETLRLIQSWNPDFFIGWHVIGFDFMFLERKCREYGLELIIGRSSRPARLIERKGVGYFADIDGRVVIDGPVAMRSAFYQFDDFKLETVAREILGEGKDIEQSGHEKVMEIERRFREDKQGLAYYNIQDTELVSRIFIRTQMIEFIWSRVCLGGLLADRVGVSTAAFDFFFLPKLHRKGFVAPNALNIERGDQNKGGHVFGPEVGLHEMVAVLDFKSLYPTIIQTFHIDPYSRLIVDEKFVPSPSGVAFSRHQHILPERLTQLMSARERSKEQGQKALSQAIKILMNSFYGVMGSSRSRFYHADLSSAVTESAKWCLLKVVHYLEREGHDVLYGDTDSVFIKLKEHDRAAPFDRCERLCRKINEYLEELIKKEFNVESKLCIEFEKLYKKIFFSPLRSHTSASIANGGSSGEGAKKRYAGLLIDREGNEQLNFVGMEFVRSDWTKLAKKFQYDLYQQFFHEEKSEDFIREMIESLKAGEFDELLHYKKRLSKAPEEYQRNIPPHVKATLLIPASERKYLREVIYVMTRGGPEPLGQQKNAFDYQHYIDKQLRPIAEVVLNAQNKSFDDILTGDQLNLFI